MFETTGGAANPISAALHPHRALDNRAAEGCAAVQEINDKEDLGAAVIYSIGLRWRYPLADLGRHQERKTLWDIADPSLGASRAR
jgi:hypothetical protein